MNIQTEETISYLIIMILHDSNRVGMTVWG